MCACVFVNCSCIHAETHVRTSHCDRLFAGHVVCTVQFKAVCDGIMRFEYDQVSSHLVVIEGDQVNLDPTCGAFITMNPVCKVGSLKRPKPLP